MGWLCARLQHLAGLRDDISTEHLRVLRQRIEDLARHCLLARRLAKPGHVELDVGYRTDIIGQIGCPAWLAETRPQCKATGGTRQADVVCGGGSPCQQRGSLMRTEPAGAMTVLIRIHLGSSSGVGMGACELCVPGIWRLPAATRMRSSQKGGASTMPMLRTSGRSTG